MISMKFWIFLFRFFLLFTNTSSNEWGEEGDSGGVYKLDFRWHVIDINFACCINYRDHFTPDKS
jgi:hypothetical protein